MPSLFFISLSDYARIFIMKTKTGKIREQTYGIASFLYYFYTITTTITELNLKKNNSKKLLTAHQIIKTTLKQNKL